jgi:4-amino-4-deoxy-L-arabinose transferase-like glycosyltransferase
MLTSLEYFYLGKAAVTDMTLNLCLMISLLSFIEKRYLLFYLFAALAVLTKGPIGLFFPGAIAFLYLLIMNRWSELSRMSIVPGILLFAVVAAPWYGLMTHYHGAAFVDTFLGFHNVTRFTSPEHASGAVWYYFIPVLLVGFFPWTPILFQSIWTALTSNSRERPILLFFILWAAVVFVFFSLSATKLVSYILPMFPALAVVAGWYINQLMEQGRAKPRTAITLVTILLGSALIFGLFKALDTMPYLEAGVLGCAAVILIMTCLAAFFCWRRSIGNFVAVQVVGMALFVTMVTSLLMPALAPYFASQGFATEFLKEYDGVSPIHVQKFLQPGVAFYAEKFGREFKTGDQLSALLRKGDTGYVLVQRKMVEKLPPQDQQKLVEVAAVADKLLMRIR